MDMAIEILGYGGLVPAGISIAVVWLSRRLLPQSVAHRYAFAGALATAFFVGYSLLPWSRLMPERHWQWLPYLSAVAVLLGPIRLAAGVFTVERWSLYLLLAVICAWLLVPTWTDLQPPRPIMIALLGAYLFLLAAGLDLLPDRLLGRRFLALLAMVSASVAVLLAASISLKFGQLAGIATAALAGCWASSLWRAEAGMPRGLIPVFVALVAGLAFVGCIEPQPPRVGMLLAPAAPLALWACAWGPLARLQGRTALAVQVVTVLMPLAVAIVWVVIADGS